MSINQITEKFHAQGLRGVELQKMVYGYAYTIALMTGNDDAASHFAAKYEAL